MPSLRRSTFLLGLFASLFASVTVSSTVQTNAAGNAISFGIITDVHYANATPSGTRFYRDSLKKVTDATRTITNENADFMMELGDFKDTDVSQHCNSDPSPHCVNLTVGFLTQIEQAMDQGYSIGPHFHVLGNHDVDVLNQSIVLDHERNGEINPGGGDGYYSFMKIKNTTTNSSQSDVRGCLVTMSGDSNVWIVHNDGTRNWLSYHSVHCLDSTLPVPDISVYAKRHGGKGAYALDQTQSMDACNNNVKCSATPKPSVQSSPVLRFIVLNGDYTDHDVAWKDLDLPFPGEAWDKPNLPTFQMTWLAAELEAALTAQQKVIVFVHYRLDGGPNGPVGKGLGPPMKGNNNAWIDDCSLQNAEVVRLLLEEHPGLVLATFSGHDHAPNPPWTHEAENKPVYFTHSALVEGAYPASNSFSLVTVGHDCSLNITGYVNATSAFIPGPSNCSLAPGISQPEKTTR